MHTRFSRTATIFRNLAVSRIAFCRSQKINRPVGKLVTKVDNLTDESYIEVNKMVPMPKMLYVALAVISAIILLW